MTKSKSDSLRTRGNKRISPYGEYYISVKKIDILKYGIGHPILIRAVFETCPKYFNKRRVERWIHNIPISASAYGLRQNIYRFDISIFFSSLTTLNIIEGKRFIRLLLEDAEIYDALCHLLSAFNNISVLDLPGNPPMSTFESFLKRQILDIETGLKLQIDYPIAFEDIEEARNVEIREQALRKFGYENYVKEGFKKKKIEAIIVDRYQFQSGNNIYVYLGTQTFSTTTNEIDVSPERFNPKRNKDEKIILLTNDIAFLQVKDPSNGKIYFLKVPPDMRSVQEAKAWTFGLEKEEYNPEIET